MTANCASGSTLEENTSEDSTSGNDTTMMTPSKTWLLLLLLLLMLLLLLFELLCPHLLVDSKPRRGLWDLVWPSAPEEEMKTDDDWQRISVNVHSGGGGGSGDFEIVFEGVIGE